MTKEPSQVVADKATRLAIAMLLFAMCAGAASHAPWIQVRGGAWEPDQVVLSELQNGIAAYVKTEAAKREATLSGWDGYRFQYQGQIKGGKRFVFVNAFCQSLGEERLQTEFLFVFDGGPCFFTLEYDPRARTFRSLRFNGYG